MIRRYGIAFRVLLALADSATAVALLVLVLALRFGSAFVRSEVETPFTDPFAIAAYAVLWPFSLWTQGLYRHRARWTVRGEIGDIVRAVVIFAAIILSILFASKNADASRLVLFVLFPLLALGALLTRLLLRRVLIKLRQQGRDTQFMLVLGTTPHSQAFADLVEGHPTLGLQVIGHLAEGAEPRSAITRPTLGTLESDRGRPPRQRRR